MPAHQHVHIGTERFGLGFVGYFSNKLKFSTTFLNRNAESSRARNDKLREKQQYRIKYGDDASNEDTINFKTLELFDEKNVGPAPDLIAHSGTLLLTTAVGESQISKVAPLIAEALKIRKKTAPLFVIACENGQRCSSELARQVTEKLGTQKHAGVFLDCVVDQICERISLDDELVTVSAENYREWIIAKDPRLEEVLQDAQIRFVESAQLDLYELRKLWLVNGFHLALAILGATVGGGPNTLIKQVLESTDPELNHKIKGVQTDLVEALLHEKNNFFGFAELQDYIDKTSDRFKSTSDDCRRILRQILFDPERITQITRDFGTDLGRNTPLKTVFKEQLYQCVFSFFEKVQKRLYEPAYENLKRNTGKDLLFVLIQLVPFLVQRGESLIGSDFDD